MPAYPTIRRAGQAAAALMERCWRDTRDFLFPPACLLCGAIPAPAASTATLCLSCVSNLLRDGQDVCQRCAAPVGPNLQTAQGCHYCRAERFAFRRVLALGTYADDLRQAVLIGKEARGAPVVKALTDLFLDRHLAELLTEPFDAIVPVPHHWSRRFWKIHSASDTLGERLARRLQRRYAPHILFKPRPTPLQAAAPASQRRRQQRTAFEVTAGLRLDGARVVLVDDVLTTGATADAAARTLLAAGAADVLVAVLARAIGRPGHIIG